MHNTHDAFVSAKSVSGYFGSGQFALHFGHARFQTGLVVFEDVQPAARNVALLDCAAQLVAAQVGFLPHSFQLLKNCFIFNNNLFGIIKIEPELGQL
jgi:hypothetical protein